MRQGSLARSAFPILAALSLVGAAAPAVLAQSGAPVSEDSPIYKSFLLVKTQPAYHVTINMQSNDPRMAKYQAMGMGFSPMEKIVQGNTSQVAMHMKIPALDVPGTIDDWEIRAVVQNGHAARLITSPAVPRYLKRADQMLDMQMAMLEKQATGAIAQAAAEGPLGAIRAAVTAGDIAMGMAEMSMLRKQTHEFYAWKCLDQPAGQGTKDKAPSEMTDLRTVGDEMAGGAAATGYEFYVHDGDRVNGPVHLLVAKESGLPLRIDMKDPRGQGSVQMNYDYSPAGAPIEVPDCLGKAK